MKIRTLFPSLSKSSERKFPRQINSIPRICFAMFCLPTLVFAGTSASYTLSPETLDGGGKRGTSANYAIDSSISGVAGTTAGSPTVTKGGFIGQLYEITGFAITAIPATVNENTTRQLIAGWALDDATLLAFNPALVTWSVLNGPLTSITASGVATAGTVFQNTAATVRGVFGSETATLPLTVANVNPDDFGSYAGDGLDDAWQNQYFGLNNPNAGPNVDFDGTGQTNLFKYTAGLNPLDPNSRFTLTIRSVPGEPARKNLIFAPRLTDRIYTVTAKPSLLTGSYTPLTNPSAPSDNGQERTITDLNANDAVKFYRIEITKP